MWLRDIEGLEFRSLNVPWMTEMQRWTEIVVDKVRPQLFSNGGNIILLQIGGLLAICTFGQNSSHCTNALTAENEYNGGDQDYVDWAIDMAYNLTTDVPWNMCHEEKNCIASGNQDIICSINGFWMDEFDKVTTRIPVSPPRFEESPVLPSVSLMPVPH